MGTLEDMPSDNYDGRILSSCVQERSQGVNNFNISGEMSLK